MDSVLCHIMVGIRDGSNTGQKYLNTNTNTARLYEYEYSEWEVFEYEYEYF